ncbi:alpha/beta hydrolase [Sphingosinicella sp. CPCC 101087]|uniref:alpha/beta hydrolase n=1 Tax=Sphingosinicella sp. CPCC 101087 TaxID=2497754 RepID=UPI00101DBF4C|nr:alpha/beta hydrolase-fold protein [Sphingosinicella sp. CPCC 101087]
MKGLLALALLALPLTPAAMAEPWQIERSAVETIEAPDGHAYRILVAWPEGEPPAQGWPVLWVLDGEDNFAIAAVTARRLARAGVRSGVGPGLVVAIDSGPLARRVLDYTPPLPGYAIPAGAPAHGLATGGGDAFLGFLETRVRPEIERRWRVDPGRHTLIGHSFGALLALQALAQGRSWTGIVAVSPSLWFGDGRFAAVPPSEAARPVRGVLIASGDAEQGPAGPAAPLAEALAARLRARGLPARHLALSGQTHGTTLLAALGQAVALAFATEPLR